VSRMVTSPSSVATTRYLSVRHKPFLTKGNGLSMIRLALDSDMLFGPSQRDSVAGLTRLGVNLVESLLNLGCKLRDQVLESNTLRSNGQPGSCM
jgi:hypothetical protein